ncbi:hypothetical protein GY31_13520 [Lysinibacillus sphaericus]|uniref:DUF6241 domain-containing protein n=1 Tax=Lysinibacillus TaxID=400634 RepID=UPI00084A966C|nr:DUF6241 domain-containing protein [Lysinibacillus sphaericus]OEC01308.1 hypothetical protein GY31_13520 [Lysinibacillus sphaericus]
MQRKTKSAIVLIAVLVIFGGIFGYIKFTEQLGKPTPEKEKAAVGHVEVTIKDNTVSEAKENIPYPDDLEEFKMRNIIHNMSHQKVKTENDIKIGNTQITQAKVDRLLEIAKLNMKLYDNGDVYIKILERWSGGDFSNAVEDHNSIWEMQNGEVGKAIRLLTPEEEKSHIKFYFTKPLKPENSAQ